MQQLIEKITTQYDISEDDIIGIINIIATYAEEKSPGLGNSLVNIINDQTATEASAHPAAKEETIFDKATTFVEGHIPGSLKEKGEEMLGEMGNKLKGLFN